MSLIIPENYKSNLNGRETEKAIKFIKDTFQHEIISALNLQRISAPLFVRIIPTQPCNRYAKY